MQGVRVLVVVTAISGAAALAGALDPQLDVAFRPPVLYVAVETAALLIALSAAFLAFGRFLRRVREAPGGRAPPETAVLEERRRIACNLHDGLAQELAYLRRNLTSLNGTVDAETRARLQQAAERAYLEARLAISALGAPGMQSVKVTVAEAASEVAARDHIRLELDVASDIRLPAIRAEALVRIACEAVGNAAHHSGAERVNLSLRRDGSRVRLRVSDSGAGFDPAGPATGFGLISMRERASSVGGDLRISTMPGHGTAVEATL